MSDATVNLKRIGTALIEISDLVDGFCNEVHDLEPIWDLQAQVEAGIADALEPLVETYKTELKRRISESAAAKLAKFPQIAN